MSFIRGIASWRFELEGEKERMKKKSQQEKPNRIRLKNDNKPWVTTVVWAASISQMADLAL